MLNAETLNQSWRKYTRSEGSPEDGAELSIQTSNTPISNLVIPTVPKSPHELTCPRI